MLMSQVKVYTREEWGALPPKSVEPMETPIPFISLCYIKPRGKVETVEDEMRGLRDLQNHQMELDGMPDIQSNFFVGKNGSIYEGRGWHAKPSHGEYSTLKQRQNRGYYLEITYIHDYTVTPEKNPLLKATSELLREGLRRNLICKHFSFLETIVMKRDGSSLHTGTITPPESSYPQRPL